jgi:hypothetical protein
MLGKFNRLKILTFELLKANTKLSIEFQMKSDKFGIHKNLLILRLYVNQNISRFGRVNKILQVKPLKLLKLFRYIIIELNIPPVAFPKILIDFNSIGLPNNLLNHSKITNKPDVLLALLGVILTPCLLVDKAARSKCVS